MFRARIRVCLCSILIKQLQRRLPVSRVLESLWSTDAKSRRRQTVRSPRAATHAQISPAQSVSDQLAYLATASQARDNGRFVDNLGNTMPW